MNSTPPRLYWVNLLLFLTLGYVLIFAQARLTFFRDVTGAQLDLLPGLMVYAALALPPGWALGSAAILGLLFDSLSANALGATVASLLAVTAVMVRFRDLLLSDQFFTQWVTGLCASGVAPLLALAWLKLVGEKPLAGAGTLWQWAIMTAGGGVITPLWFRLFNRLDKAFRYPEVPESVFSPDRQIARGKH